MFLHGKTGTPQVLLFRSVLNAVFTATWGGRRRRMCRVNTELQRFRNSGVDVLHLIRQVPLVLCGFNLVLSSTDDSAPQAFSDA